MKLYCWKEPKKTTLNHVLPPKHYTLNTDVHTWLEMFELYLDSNNVFHTRQRCNALLSRMDYECSTLIKNYVENYEASGFFSYGKKVNDNYLILRETMIKLFGAEEENETISQSLFAQRAQSGGENIHKYFANLTRLCNAAYKTLTILQRRNLISNRFIDGLTSDNLRQKILSEYIEGDNVLELADRYNKICNRRQVGTVINRMKTKTMSYGDIRSPSPHVLQSSVVDDLSLFDQRQCYQCLKVGHIKRYCPLKSVKTPIQYKPVDVQPLIKATLMTVEHVRELYGTCKIDDVSCNYLLDTGSNRTIIHERMIPPHERVNIKPTEFNVLTATGELANISGVKRCKLQIGNTACYGDFLVARDLFNECLIGMDVLATCPLTRDSITQLYNSINVVLSPITDEFVFTAEHGDELQCCRIKTLSRDDYAQMQGVETSHLPKQREDDFNLADDELPAKVFHDVFNVVDEPKVKVELGLSLD